ncbi:MAG TPA: outer membrane protein assembly factor BamE [Gammaproteobacteria bacterium]|nr:outer membrane protein assembly factor BamE [Gammaproteobacteria bacterium]
MPLQFLPLIILLILGSSYGCSRNVDGSWKAPLVYRIDIQQGNVIDQEMLNRLQPGMDKEKVKFIMGTPLIMDPFHSNRWDYVYSMEPGGGERSQRRVTLYFRDDKLDYVDGDISVNPGLKKEDNIVKDRAVVVPLEEHEDGFFDRMFSKDGKEKAEDTLAEEPASIQDETANSADEEVPPASNVIGNETGERDSAAQETAGVEEAKPEQDKNLLRRFWDRMTSGADDSTIDEGVESERDRRDAEVLEKAGGEL